MNTAKYQAEVIGTALNVVDDAKAALIGEGTDVTKGNLTDYIYDSLLHETIDGHKWIIYYSYNQDVIANSSNPEAWEDIYSQADIGKVLSDKGLTGLYQTLAYFAMFQDVADELDTALELAVAA